jgi:hypothetical protein
MTPKPDQNVSAVYLRSAQPRLICRVEPEGRWRLNPNPDADEGMIRVAKVRFEETGEKGVVRMRFDRPSARFLLLDDTQGEQSFSAR